VETLVELGFTPLEAEIYVRLLRDAPVTGYRVAQSLGKPAANVYKAIESLQAKGAVLVDEGRTRVCRPVPHDELLDRLERSFRDRRRRAEGELSRLRRDTSDDRVYALHDPEQVFQRARRMISEAKCVVLADAFPEPLTELAPDLAAAHGRDVTVAVKAYRPVELGGGRSIVGADAERVLASWPGQQLNVVADAERTLLALFDTAGKRLLQAVWSASTYLSCLTHSWLAAEISHTELVAGLEAGESRESLLAAARELRGIIRSSYPGYETFLRRFGGGRK
jgi:hypothetical protein